MAESFFGFTPVTSCEGLVSRCRRRKRSRQKQREPGNTTKRTLQRKAQHFGHNLKHMSHTKILQPPRAYAPEALPSPLCCLGRTKCDCTPPARPSHEVQNHKLFDPERRDQCSLRFSRSNGSDETMKWKVKVEKCSVFSCRCD